MKFSRSVRYNARKLKKRQLMCLKTYYVTLIHQTIIKNDENYA